MIRNSVTPYQSQRSEQRGEFLMAGLSVFLVEDNQKIRDHLIPALAEMGSASVMAVAGSEDEAIDWLARHKGEWDLAVVDLFLEQGSGLGVVKWCQGREPTQRVAVLTNYAAESVRKACLAAGADAFFDKSTQLEEFFEFCLDRP
ncbi:response regulator [Variovorax sp. J22P168]|uniref:response regulator n=1 Tax=Variovorax jilinensis TaxID=3053513 RepID=UPI002575CEC2|nr:response regulator [Variovorax sp. J22P168]MDM0015830.1 response regulator [Variovorax sp. J22P168]